MVRALNLWRVERPELAPEIDKCYVAPEDCSGELTQLAGFCDFHKKGKNIFRLTPSLYEAFANSDLDNMPFALPSLPYRHFYVSLPRDSRLALPDPDLSVDGAYVNDYGEGGSLQVLLTTRRASADYSNPVHAHALKDEQILFTLHSSVLDQTLLGALEESLVNPLLISPDGDDRVFERYYLHGKFSLSHGRAGQTAEDLRRRHAEMHGVLDRTMRIILNTILYVTQYPAEVESAFPEDAPAKLVQKHRRAAKAKDRKRVESKLASLGFTQIKFCGLALDFKAAEAEPDVAEPRQVASHWRRGHWRYQSRGPSHSLRSWVWIRPTLVNRRGKANADVGHVYDVIG